jgi:hypothetical protein
MNDLLAATNVPHAVTNFGNNKEAPVVDASARCRRRAPRAERPGEQDLLKVELTCANAVDERCPHRAGESELGVRNRVVANSNLVGALGYFDAVVRLAASALPPHIGDGMCLGHPVLLLSSRKKSRQSAVTPHCSA